MRHLVFKNKKHVRNKTKHVVFIRRFDIEDESTLTVWSHAAGAVEAFVRFGIFASHRWLLIWRPEHDADESENISPW